MAKTSASSTILRRMTRRPGELFTFADFYDLPPAAIGPALSRLRAKGKVSKARKGVYFVPRETELGKVPVDPVAIVMKLAPGSSHLTGLTAANALGLTTQVPAITALAVDGVRFSDIPGVKFSKRTGTKRAGLKPKETALFEVLRRVAKASDLDPEETTERLVRVVHEVNNPARFLGAAMKEPPRVRAMTGALSEAAGIESPKLDRLHKSLNPVTKYEFGPLASLDSAENWYARRHAA